MTTMPETGALSLWPDDPQHAATLAAIQQAVIRHALDGGTACAITSQEDGTRRWVKITRDVYDQDQQCVYIEWEEIDLVAFLRARLDEEERVAIAAGSPRDGVPTEPSWGVQSEGWDAALPDGCGVVVAPDGDGVAVVHGARRAAHIATWDPARVLAEVAAKRAVVDLYEPYWDSWGELPEPGIRPDTDREYFHRKAHAALLALAQPHAGHPDFDPSWRVEAAPPAWTPSPDNLRYVK